MNLFLSLASKIAFKELSVLCELCQHEAVEGHNICMDCAQMIVRLDRIRGVVLAAEQEEALRPASAAPRAKSNLSSLFSRNDLKPKS